jgi:hypothetical protein
MNAISKFSYLRFSIGGVLLRVIGLKRERINATLFFAVFSPAING